MSLKNIFTKKGIQQRKEAKEIKAFKKLKGIYDKLDKKLSDGKISQSELNKHKKLLEELKTMAKKFTLENGSIKLVDPQAAKKQDNVTLNSEEKEQFLKTYKQKVQEQAEKENAPAPEDIEYMQRMQDLKEQEIAAQQKFKEEQIKKERLQELHQQDAMQQHAFQQQEAQKQQEAQRQQALQQQEMQRQQAMQQEAQRQYALQQQDEQRLQPQQAIESVAAQRQRAIQQQQDAQRLQAMQQEAMEYARQQEQQVPQQIPPLKPQRETVGPNIRIVLQEGREIPVYVDAQRIPDFIKALEETMKTNSFFNVEDILINPSKILFLKIE